MILIGGAPGTGKSRVAARLFKSLGNCVWLDGDDLWRMNPFVVSPKSKEMVLRNAAFMLSSFLEESFSYIIFSWVMHEPQIVENLLSRLSRTNYKLLHFTLYCSEEELLKRIAGSGLQRDPQMCLDRLRSIRSNYPEAIDTDKLSAEDITGQLLQRICRDKT